MYSAHYEPFGLFSRLNGEYRHRLANPSRRHAATRTGWMPAVDIRESEAAFILTADLPGVDRSAVVITVEDGILSFQGERAAENREQDGDYRRRERAGGRFLRKFSLPDEADAGNISATVTDGVLEIVIPKQLKHRPRKITVN